MLRNILYAGVMFAFLIAFAGQSYSLDFNSIDDQASYRCSEEVVAIGDLDRSVREKCGDPLEIKKIQDHGPIWIYYHDQANFMYYLEFLNGKLQRIASAPCSPDDPDCLDLEY